MSFAQVKIIQECFHILFLQEMCHIFNFCTVSSLLLSYISPSAFWTLFRDASKDRNDGDGTKRSYYQLQGKQDNVLSKFVISLGFTGYLRITIPSSFLEEAQRRWSWHFNFTSKSRIISAERQMIFEALTYWICERSHHSFLLDNKSGYGLFSGYIKQFNKTCFDATANEIDFDRNKIESISFSKCEKLIT